jgi:transcriptional regulator of arginine metabolism
MHDSRTFMHAVTDPQSDRRATIVKLLREQAVGRQAELVRLLRKEGHEATQSSVSRDLRDLGVMKAGDRYFVPDDASRVNNDFDHLATFVRAIRPSGPSITVIRTTIGAAQSIAAALDNADWPEVIGTISGDDTIFIATQSARQQRKVLERLHSIFKV